MKPTHRPLVDKHVSRVRLEPDNRLELMLPREEDADLDARRAFYPGSRLDRSEGERAVLDQRRRRRALRVDDDGGGEARGLVTARV